MNKEEEIIQSILKGFMITDKQEEALVRTVWGKAAKFFLERQLNPAIKCPYDEGEESFYLWMDGFDEGFEDGLNHKETILKNYQNEFLELLSEVTIREDYLSDEQLKALYSKCHNEVLDIQREAYKRHLEL